MQLELKTKLDKILNFFGFEDKNALGIDEVNPRLEFAKSLNYSESLSKYMIYESYCHENMIFSLKDDFKGFFLEISPKVGVEDKFITDLECFFKDEMPSDILMQFTMIASHEVSCILDEWEKVRVSDLKILDKFANKRREFLKQKAVELDRESVLPRNFRLIVSVSEKNPAIQKFLDFKRKLISKFKNMELFPSTLESQDLIDIVSSIATTNLLSSKESSEYNEYQLLKNQVLNSGKTKINSDSIVFNEKVVTKVYNVKSYPKEFSLNHMINLLGGGSKDGGIPARFIISLSIKSISESDRASLVARGVSVIKSAEKGHGRMTNIGDEASEWMGVVRCASSGARFLETSLIVSITSHSDKIDEACVALTSLFNTQGFGLNLISYMQLLGLLSILPMSTGYYFEELKKFKLTSMRLSSEISAILPVHGEWKGVPLPGVLMLARRGQLFHFNPFYRIGGGNYNIAVYGESGGGKSVFLQEMVSCMVAQKVKVFALDIGQSYKNLCSLMKGEMIRFSKGIDISLNPFSKLKLCKTEDEKDDLLTAARSIIYSMTGAESKLSMSIVDKALADLVKDDLEINMTSIALSIKKDKSKEAQDLSKTMFAYTKDGIYGKYFDKDSNIKFDKEVTVFEFEEIKNDVGLLSVVLQVISMQIFLQVLTGDRKTQFMLIVDEAWMILDYCAKFLGDLARTIRKYGGSLVTCVQNYTDFQKTDETRNILANSTWSITLKQKKDGIEAMSKYGVEERILSLVRSLSIVPGKYSEMLFVHSSVTIVGRLALDKYSATLYSTDASDFRFIEDQIALGKTTDEAAELLVEEKSKIK